MANNSPKGVLGVFSHLDTLCDAIEQLKSSNKDLTVYSPCPRHEIDHAVGKPTSPIRRFTLIGGLLGATCGYLFTSYGSLDWILPTSGKSIVAIEAFTVIAFELTILMGCIFTVAGVAINSRFFQGARTLYDPRFSDDKFGIFVPCDETNYDEVAASLEKHGAEEVQRA